MGVVLVSVSAFATPCGQLPRASPRAHLLLAMVPETGSDLGKQEEVGSLHAAPPAVRHGCVHIHNLWTKVWNSRSWLTALDCPTSASTCITWLLAHVLIGECPTGGSGLR